MNEAGRILGSRQLHSLFEDLSDTLKQRGVAAQLFVVGGAAMALAYDSKRTTRDVDALFVPAPEVRDAAIAIAERNGLEPDWLNDGAKGFMPEAHEGSRTVFESESLLVQVPPPEYLLAMKLRASRDERDLADAARLFNFAKFTTAQDAIDLLTRTFPPALLLPKHKYIAEDVANRARLIRQQKGRSHASRPHQQPATPRPDLGQSGPGLTF